MSSYFNYVKTMSERMFPGIKHVNQDMVINKTLPTVSNVSYILHSVKFLTPTLFSQICGKNSMSISRALLVNSLVGNLWYLFGRRHMKSMDMLDALVLASLGSVFFNLGSILVWSLSREYLPDNNVVLIAFGVLSGLFFLSNSRFYLHYVDKQF